MATIKIYNGSFYMRNSYNNRRPRLSNMSFLFICKYMFLQIKACRAYCRNLGQCSILAKKGTYEKCSLLKKGPQKFSPPPRPIQSTQLIPFCNFCKRESVGLTIGLQYALECLLLFSLYFYSRKYLFWGVRPILELNILQRSHTSSPQTLVTTEL